LRHNLRTSPELHYFPLTVFYEDTDLAGIVYYANYLRYIERARSTILEEIGIDQSAMRADDTVFAVSRIEADYLGVARLGDRLTVITTHQALSPVRWSFNQEFQLGDKLIFRAYVVAICMTTSGKPTRLPAEIRAIKE
jgi:acyl-CoA thioester hydrolase